MRAPRRWAATFLALSLLVLLVAPPLAAQTIDEIIKRGKVIVGVNTTTPIFGLAGPDGRPRVTIPTSRASRPSIWACRSSSCPSPGPTACRSC
jgi:hypothetical protein